MPFTKDNIEEIRENYKKTHEFLISIELKDTIEQMCKYFQEEANKNCKALVMVSGGKDSTVALGLCCKALGKENVIAVTAPFENDTSDILKTSKEIIKYFEIPESNYIHSPIRIMAKDNIANNNKDAIKDELGNYQEQVLEWDKTKPEDRNLAARIRMLKAYYFAQKYNARVINTSNLSENIVGWFTKWGDCVGDYYPLGCYTASEVVLIGLEMGIPEKYMFRVPDDGLIGTSDEEALGFTYNELDNEIWIIEEKKRLGNIKAFLDPYECYELLPENMLKRYKNAIHKRFVQIRRIK